MTLPCIVHLRAWAIEEIQYILEAESEDTQRWAINLGEALLRELTLSELFLATLAILPPVHFERFLQFSVRNYRVETIAALCTILAEHADPTSRFSIDQPPPQA